MILRIPVPTDRRFLSASEIKRLNEWCARLAQLTLAGAQLDNEVEKKLKNPKVSSTETVEVTLDTVPTPFVEPPEVKCEKCGNDDIRNMQVIYYQRSVKALLGFSKTGEVGVDGDAEYCDVAHNDTIEAARSLAGEWIKCGPCQHEWKPDAELKFDWY